MGDSIHDEAEGSGSSFKMGALANPNVLKIYQTGELTVVGFGGKDVPDEVCIAEYRQQLLDLIAEHGVKTMAFDLSGVQLVPSGMLGVLSTIAKRVEEVEIYNPSVDVREVLRMTKLERLFEIKEVQV